MFIVYNPYNAVNLFHAVANGCGIHAKGNSFTIPQQFGEGNVQVFNFNSGISALIAEARYNEDLTVLRNQHVNPQNFILVLHENLEKQDKKDAPSSMMPNDVFAGFSRNLVHLTTSLNTTEIYLPSNNKNRMVVIFFSKAALLNFFDYETVEKFANTYFSFYLKKNYQAPLDAEYRVVLQELHHEIENHPLINMFVENRILALIEKLFIHFLLRDKHSEKRLQFKEDEVSQLVKAESTLLEDFSKVPPTINQLSRLCAMSPTKFKNDFKALYGLPVYEYYQQHRMAYARSLIQEGEYAIKEVGIMVGYSNLGHFAAAFKKEFSMLPSEWMHANRVHPDIPPKDASPVADEVQNGQ